MIHFKAITEDNFDTIIRMKRPDSENFVAANAYSLAQAWLYRDDGDVFSFAIYHYDTPVGFMQLEEDNEENKLWLWRIMLPPEYENKGYGTAAIRLLIDYAQKAQKYEGLYLDCNPNNLNARHIYDKLGFKPTGENNHGSVEMRLPLR